ncbi:cytidylate kinase family protein [Anaerovorax odorimutans]|uniref:cytidylate kinase family protein n=1 Tax=Anaerovorax odorimutans TaxID=109327 RepID=UPI0004079D4F|nr:cytidylate kinase family protein [Anaerovorax odorimutans]
MNIITIRREFGSGGRELGKQLSDYLHLSYYDKEILDAVANQCNLDTEYVEKVIDNGMLK